MKLAIIAPKPPLSTGPNLCLLIHLVYHNFAGEKKQENTLNSVSFDKIRLQLELISAWKFLSNYHFYLMTFLLLQALLCIFTVCYLNFCPLFFFLFLFQEVNAQLVNCRVKKTSSGISWQEFFWHRDATAIIIIILTIQLANSSRVSRHLNDRFHIMTTDTRKNISWHEIFVSKESFFSREFERAELKLLPKIDLRDFLCYFFLSCGRHDFLSEKIAFN